MHRKADGERKPPICDGKKLDAHKILDRKFQNLMMHYQLSKVAWRDSIIILQL